MRLRSSLRLLPPTHERAASLPGKRATLPSSLPDAATSNKPSIVGNTAGRRG